MRPPAILRNLACTGCQGPLEESDGAGLVCGSCGRVTPRLPDGRWDFRLTPDDELTYRRHYSPQSYARALDMPLQLERRSDSPRNRFDGVVPVHLTPAQVSYLPEGREGQIALDLGCGHGRQRSVLETLGYDVYAVDFDGAAADDLVDAHALPLRDQSIQLVMSIAVLEHLADPFRAVGEVLRVLRPGGCFLGTVAFLEPFHDNSFFHFSHLGLSWVLQANGFQVETISPIASWDVLRAQIEMEVASGSRAVRAVGKVASLPLVWALEAYGALGRRFARARHRYARPLLTARHAGAFFFVARRPS
jgi:SAM-dependent methyltransferase